MSIAEALEDKKIELHELHDMITKIEEMKGLLNDIVLMGREHVDISSVIGEFDDNVVICKGKSGCNCNITPDDIASCVACRHGALAPKSLYEEIVNKRQIREFKKAEVYPAIY